MARPLKDLNIDTNQHFKHDIFFHHKGIQKVSLVVNALYNNVYYLLQNIAVCFVLFFNLQNPVHSDSALRLTNILIIRQK